MSCHEHIFTLPSGVQTALSGSDVTLSFDEVIALKTHIQNILIASFKMPPLRILGGLDDTIGSLMALLSCPELCDYMPINPRLNTTEIIHFAKNGRADAALLTKSNIDILGTKFQAMGIQVVLWDDVYNKAKELLSSKPLNTRLINKWHNNSGHLILHTSGTTGAPKRVPISIPAMMQSAQNIAFHHELKSDDLALNTLPTFHIGAIVDVLLAPFSVGGSVALTSDRTPEGLLSAVQKYRPTWIQLVPTILLHLTETLNTRQLKDIGQSLRFIRNISAPVPLALRKRAEQFIGCPIIEMYGMTETAGQISTNGRAPDERRNGSVGRKTSLKIKILDKMGNEMPNGRAGEICVTGPTVFQGYEGVSRSEIFFNEWFRTGDIGVFDEDGFLKIQGRLKEMINIGGEKVSPYEIETIALEHPDIIEAAAYALPHASLGEVCGMTIASRKPVVESDFREFLSKSLADFKAPRTLRQVDELPRLPNSKIDRLKILRDATGEHEKINKNRKPGDYNRGSVEFKVATIWAEHLKSRLPEESDDFFDMGGDSLSAISFLVSLSNALGYDVPPNQLFETPNFKQFVKAVSHPLPKKIEKRPRAVEFVAQKMAGWPGQVVLEDGLFRGIGTIQNGNSLFWCCQNSAEIDLVQKTFAARRPLYTVRSLYQLRGKSFFRFNQRSETDFKDLAKELANEINTIHPEGDICLGGFCGGAGVMQYVLSTLIKSGRTVKVFISFDYWPKAPLNCPVIHCMSNCDLNSARNALHHMHISQAILHPKGVKIFNIDGPHTWSPDQFKDESKQIEKMLDSKTLDFNQNLGCPGGWTYDKRSHPPLAKLKYELMPRFYTPGEIKNFKLTAKNISKEVWDDFESSGLAFEIMLLNLDGCIRDERAGFGILPKPVLPGETVTIEGQIRFPDKSVPMLCKGRFQSHGVEMKKKKNHNTLWKLVLPRF